MKKIVEGFVHTCEVDDYLREKYNVTYEKITDYDCVVLVYLKLILLETTLYFFSPNNKEFYMVERKDNIIYTEKSTETLWKLESTDELIAVLKNTAPCFLELLKYILEE